MSTTSAWACAGDSPKAGRTLGIFPMRALFPAGKRHSCGACVGGRTTATVHIYTTCCPNCDKSPVGGRVRICVFVDVNSQRLPRVHIYRIDPRGWLVWRSWMCGRPSERYMWAGRKAHDKRFSDGLAMGGIPAHTFSDGIAVRLPSPTSCLAFAALGTSLSDCVARMLERIGCMLEKALQQVLFHVEQRKTPREDAQWKSCNLARATCT